MNIIIIDDEVELIEIYKIVLLSEGHTVEAFSSSVEALERIKEKKFDLIISDKKMPKVSGLDILNYTETNTPETPVFIITGDDNEKVQVKNPKSLSLRKPIELTVLIEKINSLQ